MDHDVPKKAAQNNPVDITLCGKTYQFKEPVKRRADFLLGKGLELLFESGVMDAAIASNAVSPAGSIDVGSIDMNLGRASGKILQSMGDLLDFIYDAMGVPKEDIKRIEREYDQKEVLAAFERIMEALQRPFGGGNQNLAEVE